MQYETQVLVIKKMNQGCIQLDIKEIYQVIDILKINIHNFISNYVIFHFIKMCNHLFTGGNSEQNKGFESNCTSFRIDSQG